MPAPELPPQYQAALATAKAMQTAAATPLDPVAVTSHMSEQVATARQQAALWAKPILHALWAPVNPYSDAQVKQFAVKAAQVMASAQTAAGRVAAAAQVQQLAAVGIRVDGVPSLPVDVRATAAKVAHGKLQLERRPSTVEYANGDTTHITVSDMTTESVFERPASGFRWVETQDGDGATESGLRIDTIVDDNLMLAQRLAQQQVIVQAVDLDQRKDHGGRQPVIVGYRRVIHPELSRGGTCGMCIAAADRIYHVAELMPIHAHCHCTIAAITEGHDPGDEANQADLKQLYSDSGGTSAAHLKRTRYQVNEHGELGPVLVPQRAYKPRSK